MNAVVNRIHIRLPIPRAQLVHLSRVAIVEHGALELANNQMVRNFIECHPWSNFPALQWRNPITADQDTLSIEITLDHNTSSLMMRTIDDINTINARTLDAKQVSPRIFLATVIHWWVIHVHPLTPEYS